MIHPFRWISFCLRHACLKYHFYANIQQLIPHPSPVTHGSFLDCPVKPDNDKSEITYYLLPITPHPLPILSHLPS
jgi:hypothetical protein